MKYSLYSLLLVAVILFFSLSFATQTHLEKKEKMSQLRSARNAQMQQRAEKFQSLRVQKNRKQNPKKNKIAILPEENSQSDSLPELWKRTIVNGLESSSDEAKKTASDNYGNIIITGSSNNKYCNADIVTIKYAPNGDTLWTARYAKSTLSDESPVDLQCDSIGNICVTANIYQQDSTRFGILILKYSPSGTLMTNRIYDTQSSEWLKASLVDKNGNLYINGTADDSVELLLKFSTDGQLLWEKKFTRASENGSNFIYDFALTPSGNICIIKDSSNSFALISYSASGDEIMRVFYESEDFVQSQVMAIDKLGNILITGYTIDEENDYYDEDFITIKYNSSGVLDWSKIYHRVDWDDEVVDIATDKSNSVYITGTTYPYDDETDVQEFLTIKYSSTGVLRWAQRYKYDNDYYSEPTSLAVDSAGMVAITGYSGNYFVVIKYTTGGTKKWFDTISVKEEQAVGYHIIFDKYGSAIATGSCYNDSNAYDFLTVKYDSDGVRQFKKFYEGAGTTHLYLMNLIVDKKGNTYTASHTKYKTRDELYFTKMSPNGVLLSEILIDTPFTLRYKSNSKILLDNQNAIYYVNELPRPDEFFGERINTQVCKYTADGVMLWSREIMPLPQNYSNILGEIAIDSSQNLYLGYVKTGSPYTGYLIKYDQYGAIVWSRIFDYNLDYMRLILKIDVQGNILLARTAKRKLRGSDVALTKFNPNGDSLWSYEYNISKYDYSIDVATDALENIFLLAHTNNGLIAKELRTIKLTATGNFEWASKINFNPNGSLEPAQIGLDNFNNIYSTGYYKDSTNSVHYYVKKMNQSGTELWSSDFNTMKNNARIPAMMIDINNNVNITGAHILNYTSSGILQYALESSADFAGIDENRNLFVAHRFSSLFTVSKYQLPVTDVIVSEEKSSTFALNQNYPNPFNSFTVIKFQLTHNGTVSLTVFNILGQKVATIIDNEEMEQGYHSVNFDASRLSSGVYFYRITVNNNEFVQMKKLLLLK
ncbi:MAG: T9SS type A sorting domain-containing protein [Bacteroidota bacterium]